VNWVSFVFLVFVLSIIPGCQGKRAEGAPTQEMHTQNSPKGISWSDAKSKIRPQIIRRDYLKAHAKTVHTMFAEGLEVAYVLDFGKSNRFVTSDDAAAWGKSPQELYAAGLANLQNISKGISIKALGNEIVMIDAGDSYDAARLLLPPIQKQVREFLGDEFRVGIPNRDFLIFWSQSLDADATEKLEKQIAEEFAATSYPLSNQIMVFRDGRFTQLRDY
jgi:uncharacterized protein YtpQ (UPF0354 family)